MRFFVILVDLESRLSAVNLSEQPAEVVAHSFFPGVISEQMLIEIQLLKTMINPSAF